MKKFNSEKILLFLGILGLILSIPSIIYLFINGTVYDYYGQDYYFIGAGDTFSTVLGTIIFGLIVILSFVLYFKILKKSNEFKDIKSVILSVIFVSLLFMICLPNTSTDVFYYMGTGRLLDKYNQNPYFTSVNEFLEDNPEVEDEILESTGYWSNEVVLYGPFFVSICGLISKFSFGSITYFLYLYKMVMLVIHVLCTYIVYKLTGRKKFALMYGLNPFLLIEFLVNCHNDIFVVFLTLLGFYFLKKKKNIWVALMCLASSVLIKYVTVILLPFAALYAVKDKTKLKKVLWCLVYAIFTVTIILIISLPFYKEISNMFEILGNQQDKIMNSIYLILCHKSLYNFIDLIQRTFIILFIYYLIISLVEIFLYNKKVSDYMKYIKNLLLILIFGILTNLGMWYLSWLFIPIFWLKSKNINNILWLQFFAELSYVFLFWVHSDATQYQVKILPFIFGCMIIMKLIKIIKKHKEELSCKKMKSMS